MNNLKSLGFALLSSLFVFSAGCADDDSTEIDSSTETNLTSRGEGSMCGGIAGFRCDEGLTCVIPKQGHGVPDAAGRCQKAANAEDAGTDAQ